MDNFKVAKLTKRIKNAGRFFIVFGAWSLLNSMMSVVFVLLIAVGMGTPVDFSGFLMTLLVGLAAALPAIVWLVISGLFIYMGIKVKRAPGSGSMNYIIAFFILSLIYLGFSVISFVALSIEGLYGWTGLLALFNNVFAIAFFIVATLAFISVKKLKKYQAGA